MQLHNLILGCSILHILELKITNKKSPKMIRIQFTKFLTNAKCYYILQVIYFCHWLFN